MTPRIVLISNLVLHFLMAQQLDEACSNALHDKGLESVEKKTIALDPSKAHTRNPNEVHKRLSLV